MAPLTNNLTQKFDQQRPPIGLPWKLFLFSIVIFSLTVVAYFGLRFGYSYYLNAQLVTVENQIADLAKQIPKDQQDAYFRFYSQTVNLQTLLSQHVLTSKIFPLIEANTNQGTFYSRFALDVAGKKLALEGSARSYDVLAQQLEAFRQVSTIQDSTIGESKLGDGRVTFRATLNLDPSIFKLTAQ